MFDQGQTVGQNLAGVEQVGQPVDDRNRCGLSEFGHYLMREGPGHDEINPA